MRARIVAGAGIAVVALAAFAFIGRWESRHNARVQNDRMRTVYDAATSDGLFSSRLKLYRLNEGFDCLDYAPPGRPQDVAAYELCFDAEGRLVQTADRHTGTPVFASLREQPALTAISVPVATLVQGMFRLGICKDPRLSDRRCGPDIFPRVHGDLGAAPFPGRRRKR